MKKPAHPPPSLRVVTPRDTSAPFRDALSVAIFALDETPSPTSPPKGVLPIWDSSQVPSSISLGTSRFCNDQQNPVRTSDFAMALSGYDGTTPIACIEWQRATFYREPIRDPRPKQQSLFQTQNLTRGIFNGYMSPATRRKVRKITSTWIRSIMLYRAEVKRKYDPGRAYPVFVTLTLPSKQQHTDAEINRKILQPFLIRLKRDYEIENYFWRAEAQENGNVHYHILVDRYIPKRYLQLTWNLSTDALDYLRRYFEETGSLTPPSTEIHRIREKVQDRKTGQWRTVDPVDYLIDYVMDTPAPEEPVEPKEGEEPQPRKLIGKYRAADGSIQTYVTRAIDGRVWGMSDTLRDIREPRAEATVDMVIALEKAKEQGILRRIDLEHATMYFGPISLVLSRSSLSAWKLVKEYYLHVFAQLYPAQLPPNYLRDHPPMPVKDLWLDFDNVALYHKKKFAGPSPVFNTAQELDAWIEKQNSNWTLNNKVA